MRPTELVSNIIGAVAVGLLGFICHVLIRAYKKFDQFMTEHVWLLATTLWTRDKVVEVMSTLGIEIGNPPPGKLRKEKHSDK